MENAGTYRGETVQGIYLSCMVRAGQGGFVERPGKRRKKNRPILNERGKGFQWQSEGGNSTMSGSFGRA